MGKTWIFRAQTILFGGLGWYSLILGPMFLFGLAEEQNGQPATEGGRALTIISMPFMLIYALAFYNLRARRRPLVRICREGIEIVRIGESSLDGLSMVPGLIRVAWLILSTQGFRKRWIRIPWGDFEAASVSGPPMARRLRTDASYSASLADEPAERPPSVRRIVFEEVEFKTPPDVIASSIQFYAESGCDERDQLPMWDDASSART